MEFITSLLYPVWTFARSTIESILGKRGRDEIVDNNDDDILSPSISADIFDNMSLDGDDHHIDMNYYQNFMAYEFDNVIEENNETLKNIQSDITSKPSNKSNKVNIIHIVKDNSSITKINEIVNELHLLRMLTTHLLKLFILKQKFEGKKIKIKNYINEGFIIVLMETIASNKNDIPRRMSGRVRKLPKLLEELYSVNFDGADDSSLSDDIMDKNEARKQLLAFINDVVLEESVDEENRLSQDIKELIVNGFDITKLQNTVSKIAQEIVTSYEQNIISNYKKYIERYVNVFYLRGKSAELDSIEIGGGTKEEKKKLKSLILHEFRKLKDDLVEPDPAKYKSKSPSALQFIKEHKHMLFPKSR